MTERIINSESATGKTGFFPPGTTKKSQLKDWKLTVLKKKRRQ
jgi:hypothetical protein